MPVPIPTPAPPSRLRVDVSLFVWARLVGMALLAVIVLVHNHVVVAGYATRWSLLVGMVLLGYAGVVGVVLRATAAHRIFPALVDLFFTLDLVLWVFAVYATGGERSWLVFLMILRAVDMAPFGVRRALVYAHLSVAAYAGLIAYLIGVEGRPLAWGAEAGKVAIVWATNLYIVATVAVIIERIRARRREAEAALRQRERETARLFEVTAGLAAARDLPSVLALVTAKAVELLECYAAGILRHDSERDRLAFVSGQHLWARLRGAVMRPGEGIIGRAFGDRAPVWTSDMAGDVLVSSDAETARAAEAAPRAALAVPIVTRESVWGVLAVYFAEPHEFTSSDVRMMTSFAHQAALAIDKQALLEETQAREREATRLRQAAELATRAKSDFLASMSHELRTPLNSIIGVSELLLDDARDGGRTDDVEPLSRILRPARHLLRLINDILDLSKIEAGKMELHLESVAVAPLVEDVASTLRGLAEANGTRCTSRARRTPAAW